MKIANFNASAQSGIKIFKPVQYLNIKGYAVNSDLKQTKLRVRVVNAESGRVDEIIPNIALSILGEITSMNEVFFICNYNTGQFDVNVMLHPTSAIYLSNDKYLEVDITGLDSAHECNIYGIEMPSVDKEFICRYNKFYMGAGELQKTFVVGNNENLILPAGTFEEVSLGYKSGTTCNYVVDELRALMNLKNDIVAVPSRNIELDNVDPETSLVMGSWYMCGLDVSEVDNITIRRSAGQTSYEFILIDTLKE